MKAVLLAPVLLAAGCGVGNAASPAAPMWRSSVAQAMSDLRAEPARDETCRQPLRLSAGGRQLRLRLSNALSPVPLSVGRASVALQATGAAVRPATLRPVTVSGAAAFVIPPRSHVTTDPVDLVTREGDDVMLSFAVAGTAQLSEHRFGAATGWCSGPGSGDHVRDAAGTDFTVRSRAGLVAEEVAVLAAGAPATVVAAGDSLTDAPLPVDTFPRWTDVLRQRLGATPVVNAGIAGNRVLLDGGWGPPLVERFDRDVLLRPGAGTVVLLAGTNDLSAGLSPQRLQSELARLCDRARRQGLRVVLATIPPAGRRPAEQQEARRAVNAWIRWASVADVVVDADAVLRDPARPEQLAATFDLGDGLHLSPAGHRALGEAVAAVLG